MAAGFRDRTGREVLITEFGVVRWAKDSDAYIDDLLAALEERDLGWVFHSMSGWNGWNPTFEAADAQTGAVFFGGKETKALAVLRKYWSANP